MASAAFKAVSEMPLNGSRAAASSARMEQGFIKIEFKLPDGLDPEAPKSTVYIPGTKSKGLGADGPYRYWFDHDLPDKGFKQVSKLVRRNCI
jgi:hypothetical protein